MGSKLSAQRERDFKNHQAHEQGRLQGLRKMISSETEETLCYSFLYGEGQEGIYMHPEEKCHPS